MKIEFVVDWGYRHIYFNKRYLPKMNFDGEIKVSGGELLDVQKMVFKKDRFGTFIQSPEFVPYGKSCWESVIHNNFDGFLFSVDGNENTAIDVYTNSAKVQFTVGELLTNQHILVETDKPFSCSTMHVYLKDHEWYLAPIRDDETRIKGSEFDGGFKSFFGVNGVVVGCGESVKANFDYNFVPFSESSALTIEGAVRTIQSQSAETDENATGVVDYEIIINGVPVYRNSKFSFRWDDHSNHLEESFFPIPKDILKDKNNIVEIINRDKDLVILVQMVRLFTHYLKHLQILRCPKWIIKAEPFSMKVFALYPTSVVIDCQDGLVMCTPDGKIEETTTGVMFSLKSGENEFFFKATTGGINKKITFIDDRNATTSEACVSEVWDVASELNLPKTGIEIKLDQPQDYKRYIDQMIDDAMGNYVIFRSYKNIRPSLTELWDACAKCKKYGIYTDVITINAIQWLAETVFDASGNKSFAVGTHETTGIFYWGDCMDNSSVKNMEDAERVSIETLKSAVAKLKVENSPVAVGDASGGTRYAYRAGFDIIRHETYCGHHLSILPVARGCARAYGKSVWGAHVASQHNFQIELETAVGRYWLAMYLPWVFGANFVFEEDSLFQNNKYYRMVNDDYITKAKQKVTAEYFKHIKTHTRFGSPQVDIAFIQGRYEAPFTAISSCNPPFELTHLNEEHRIWGKNGSPNREWGHRQPERGMHLLETVAPRIYLPPLMQDVYRTRKLFCSDPYGEFDFLPIEAPQNVYSQYKILFMLGWNTMCEKSVGVNDNLVNDYSRLKNYVSGGGTIVLSVPQLTKRTDREFLNDIYNADLFNGGDVRDLFGVVVGKAGEVLSESVNTEAFPAEDYNRKVDIIRQPSECGDEDGECRLAEVDLCGAEVCLMDKATRKPLLVRNKVGKGYAYLLCLYAYPGHERLKYLCVNIMRALLDLHVIKEVCVYDKEDMIYWSNWKDGNVGKLYLLNTDWTKIGSEKQATVKIADNSFDCFVKEREVLEIAYNKKIAVYSHDKNVNISAVKERENVFEIFGFGETELHIITDVHADAFLDGKKVVIKDDKENVIKLNLNGKSELYFES